MLTHPITYSDYEDTTALDREEMVAMGALVDTLFKLHLLDTFRYHRMVRTAEGQLWELLITLSLGDVRCRVHMMRMR